MKCIKGHEVADDFAHGGAGSARSGAYGFRIAGLPGAGPLLSRLPVDSPLLRVEWAMEEQALTISGVGENRARFQVAGSAPVVIDIWRDPLRARFSGLRRPDEQAFVHPFLSLVAATVANWLGQEAFHSGAFLLDGKAWALLGEKEDGKSSMLCHLATQGFDVLTDDLLVVDRGVALSGPNSLDLRAGTAQHLGVGENLGIVGERERWRVVTRPTAQRVPLAGWLSLGWAETVELVHIPVSRRVPMLLESSMLKLPARHPERLLALAALPAWELRRPRRWDSLEACTALLTERLSASG